MSAKINLLTLQYCKQIGKLNYQRSMVLFGIIKCSNDTYKFLRVTAVPHIAREIITFRKSSILAVHGKRDMAKTYGPCMVPNTIDRNLVAFVPGGGNTW